MKDVTGHYEYVHYSPSPPPPVPRNPPGSCIEISSANAFINIDGNLTLLL